jgi:hypothetical protein
MRADEARAAGDEDSQPAPSIIQKQPAGGRA